MSLTREQLINLLHLPLPELSPPGFAVEQLSGLRTLPLFCEHLKLIYGLPALEPLADRPAREAVEALLLAARILSSVGGVATRTRDLTLTDSLAAARLVLNGRMPSSEANPVVLELLSAEKIWMHYAEMGGQPEESVRCGAGLVRALWEFADQLRQSPETSAGALLHGNGWASPAAAKILRKLTLGAAVAAVPEGGLMRGFRPSAAHSGRRPAARRAAQGGRG
ncbi:MAG: hypothetical protein GY854_10470 [Deltaproteobacteria bacterium]|nr:hypothetical protein [Deltaproteobacteria bacterium]